MGKIIFLGTNGWYDTETGNTISILIKLEKFNLILDAGSGISKLDKYIDVDDDKPAYLFLSHFHLDHISGLHTISKNHFPGGLFLLGGPGIKENLSVIINQPFTLPFSEMNFHTEIMELPKESRLLPFHCEILPMVHSSPCFGITVAVEDKRIVYCPDTGYCENAVKLANKADVLITECAFLTGHVNKGWPHLNPETAAKIAVEALAKKLILTHFEARRYTSLDMRKEAEKIARLVFPESFASYDGMEVIF